MNHDTICAPATATGGALGIVRISGQKALEIASRIFSSDLMHARANSVHFGHIVAPESTEMLDEVLVSVFRAPHSYTGEDSVEISCHGSRYILNKVLELLVQQGCRLANPGEFTQRAYLNGKLDLSQAEAVADLIASTNKATHQMALSQLRGGISSELAVLREKLLKLTSLLELELDFSDHEDLEFADRSELQALAVSIRNHVEKLADSFEKGQALKQGIPVAIVGKTNVGKSTLLNQLLKDDRAIVSDIHGTTRDTIEDTIDINGINFRFIDTAGIRQTADTIEKIGIDRTYAAIEKARIVLWVVDGALSDAEREEMRKRCHGKRLIIVQNKIDQPQAKTIANAIGIAAKHGTNIEQLETEIHKAANIPEITESDVIVTSARHYEALLRARESLDRVINGLETQLSGDLVSEDLHDVLNILAEITGGEITPQETLNNIFKHFCVGK